MEYATIRLDDDGAVPFSLGEALVGRHLAVTEKHEAIRRLGRQHSNLAEKIEAVLDVLDSFIGKNASDSRLAEDFANRLEDPLEGMFYKASELIESYDSSLLNWLQVNSKNKPDEAVGKSVAEYKRSVEKRSKFWDKVTNAIKHEANGIQYTLGLTRPDHLPAVGWCLVEAASGSRMIINKKVHVGKTRVEPLVMSLHQLIGDILTIDEYAANLVRSLPDDTRQSALDETPFPLGYFSSIKRLASKRVVLLPNGPNSYTKVEAVNGAITRRDVRPISLHNEFLITAVARAFGGTMSFEFR